MATNASLQERLEKVSIEEKSLANRVRQQEKIIAKFVRDNKNLDAKNNHLDAARDAALGEKMVATNAVSALTREIEWVNKETQKEQ